MATNKYTSKDIDRFWRKVAITANPDLCWEWQASLKPNGYGQFNLHNKIVYAHRFSWEITINKSPDGFVVCHSCDNRLCVNPGHLFIGSHADNVQDKVRKGRLPSVDKTAHYGEQHGCHKLTSEQVLYIRAKAAIGDVSQVSVAREMGVSPTTISRIVIGKRWKHQS